MLGLSFSKILVLVLVIVAVWRGMRILAQVQARLAQAERRAAQGPAAARSAPRATDLVECPRCGMFVPNGTICRSREECSFRRA